MSSARPVEVHVAPSGNAFMADLGAWIVEATQLAGRPCTLSTDGSLPGDRGIEALAVVVAPHEFFELSDRSFEDRCRAATRSLMIATEQPGTTWFDTSVGWVRRAPWSLDINQAAASAAQREGVDARHLQLGAVPSMTAVGDSAERTVDVTVLAGLTDHRATRLAALAPRLWHRRCDLRLMPTDRPASAGRDSDRRAAPGGPVFGSAKYELLARSKILLNLHRHAATDYVEWARLVEAMANGCVVVTDPSAELSPCVDGEHLVVTDDPATVIERLLDEPDEIDRIARHAATLVRGDLALHRTIGPLLDDAERTFRPGSQPRTASRVSSLTTSTISSSAPVRAVRRVTARSSGRRREGAASASAPRPAFRPHRALRRDLFDAVVAERALRRRIDAARAELDGHDPSDVTVVDTPRRAAATPDVSVVVTLFDYADVVTQALDSVAASSDVELEIVVVDDHSTDESVAVVTEWMSVHPDLAVRLVARAANHGLAAARNLGFEYARAPLVMVLDADNLVYPRCLQRLAAALGDDADAVFAWSILEVFGADTGLLSAHAWDPGRLVERNTIDAQVMFRRRDWSELGGYRELDDMLAGWEDWDLWLRVAEAGRYGVLVPEILGRYRAQAQSMVSGPVRFDDVMLERLEQRHPRSAFPTR
ncbi:MAG: glycosyltransferase [Actinomycetota bacterium]